MTDLARRNGGALRPADRSLGELVSDASRDVGLLVRQEIALAKAEVRENLKHLAKGAIALGVGAALAYIGSLTMVAAFALVLIRLGAPPWLAVSVLAAVLLIGGLALLKHAASSFARANPVPRRAVESVKTTVERIKEQVS